MFFSSYHSGDGLLVQPGDGALAIGMPSDGLPDGYPLYNPSDGNPPGVNPPDGNPPGVNPPDGNPTGVNPPDGNPPGVNPPDNPPGVNPPDASPVDPVDPLC